MNVKKIIIFPVLSLIMFFMLAACEIQTAHTDGSNIESTTSESVNVSGILPSCNPDFFFLDCGNCDVYISMGRLNFTLVSGQPLNSEDVAVTIDTKVPYAYYFGAEEIERLPFDVYMCYQNVDWKHMAELAFEAAAADPMSDEIAAYYVAQNLLFDSYQGLAPEQVPLIYYYNINLAFQPTEDSPSETIDELTITVKGVTHIYNLGSIRISRAKPELSWSYQLAAGISGMDYPMRPSRDGSLTFAVEYNVKKDLTLQSLTFYDDEETVIDEISAVITYPDGMSVDTKWDGKSPVELSKGDVIELKITCHDPDMAETLYGRTTKIPVLHYTCGENAYDKVNDFSFRMRQNAYEIYAVECDGVDILSYYLDYRNPVIKGEMFAEE